MSDRITAGVLVGALALAIGSACGSNREGFEGVGEGDPNDPKNDGGLGSSGSIGSSGSSGSSGSGDSGLGECGAQTQSAKPLPLDILIMLDASGSMRQATGAGISKWASVKTALNGFISDPKSAGIGVGLQVFPITHPGAPSSCTSSTECTVGATNYGRCALKRCAQEPFPACDTAADCAGGVACAPVGGCFLSGSACLVGQAALACGLFEGGCVAAASSTCDGAECFVADYSTADVAIGALPANAAALTSRIASFPDPSPGALTPTSAAVQGGLAIAGQYAGAHPDHAVVMVLATDGLPTLCAPLDAAGIGTLAAAGVSATPSVKTFVIGVFADAEKANATSNLNAIAAGGGTGTALVISSGGDVVAEFRAALDKIRGQALPCEYELPTAQGTPDFGKVNVRYTPSGGREPVLGRNVKDASACDSNAWYYDVDPSSGGTPTKIKLCPAACDALKQDVGGATIDILVGCRTIVK